MQDDCSSITVASNVDKIVLGLSSLPNLHFLAFGSSEKDDPCNELSL